MVWCPAWPLTAAVLTGRSGRGPEFEPSQPLMVMHAQRVSCCSPAAWREGVRPGQRKRQAQGACPHVVIVPHDPDRDARCFEPVVRAIGTLVPLLDVESPGSLLLATRGPSRYVGGDVALADRLMALAATGSADALDASGGFGVGVADGRLAASLAARAAARAGRPVVVPPGSSATADFLAPYPVSVLVPTVGCDPQLIDLLCRLGLHRLGDVAALSATDLLDRFGATGVALHHLCSGTDDSSPSAIPPPPDYTVRESFDDPVPQLDMLVFAAKSLADHLDAELTARGHLCTRIVVEAESEHGETSRRVWYRAEGLRAAAIVDRVRWQLDGWINGTDPPSAGITSLCLTPTDLRADSGRQQGFWGERSRADDDAAKAITRVTGLLGPQSVRIASWCGGRDPRGVYELVPVSEVGADGRHHSERPLAPPPWPGSLPAPSPTVVHHDPVEADVLDARGRRVTVSGRGAVSAPPELFVRSSHRSAVMHWAGPWPVEERWWDQRSRRAARFQIVVDHPHGPQAYLLEISGGRWFVVGEYR